MHTDKFSITSPDPPSVINDVRCIPTLPAYSPIPVHNKVFARVWMAVLAMSFTALLYTGGTRPDSLNTSGGIFLDGHWLQVKRINATRHAAKVIQAQPIWDRTHVQLKGHPMCQFGTSSDANPAVAFGVSEGNPKPASGIRLGDIFVGESFQQRHAVTILSESCFFASTRSTA